MTSAVRVAVNEANLVKNLKFAFSNFSTFLGELIQNSRRAGATKVDIVLVGKTLTVTDDGHGIENFQNLFTVAESGWNQQTQTLENPFGMGFTSALFACERLTVESCGQRLEAPTSSLLQLSDVQVVPGDFAAGTRLTLANLSFDETRVEGALKAIARGYPIPIIFNGTSLDRPEALDCATFEQMPIGAVWIKDLSKVTLARSNVRVFLQGLLVAGLPHCIAPLVVIHLDSTLFNAKLPDRDCLIDELEKMAEIEKQVGHVIHASLAKKQREMDVVAFVETYWDVACEFSPDLLRDHPAVPTRLLSELESLACCSDTYVPYKYVPTRDAKPLLRDDFERGDHKVVLGSCYVDLECDLASALKLAYVRAIGASVVEKRLPAGHWLFSAPLLEDFDVQYEIVNPGVVAGSGSFQWDFDLQICDAIRINGVWGEVTIADDEIAVGNGEDDLHICLYSPKDVVRPGVGVEQFEDFYSDDGFDDSWYDESLDKFRRLIMQARHSKPTDLLNDLLSDIYVDTASALSTSYILQVSDIGRLTVIEQLAT